MNRSNLGIPGRWPADTPRMAGLALGYAALAKLVLAFFSYNGVVSILWLPSGIALAALLLGGKRYWPGIFMGALAGNLMASNSLPVSLGIASGNTLEALSGLWLLDRIGHCDRRLARQRDYFWIGLAGAICACVSASVGAATLLAAGFLPPAAVASNWLRWWQGDLLGIVLVTPLALVWRHPPQGWLAWPRALETLACFGLAFVVGQIIFLDWFHTALGEYAMGFFMVVFVAWSALRFGRHGTVLVIGMSMAQALLGNAKGIGYFPSPSDLVNLWLYLLVLSVVGLELALTITEQKQAEAKIQRLTKLYKALSEVSQAIVRMEQEAELFPLVCRCAVEFGGMSMAWVGRVDADSGLIVPAASHGSHLDYLDGIIIRAEAEVAEGRGPTGTALHEGRPIIVNDYFSDPSTLPWRERAAGTGWGAAAAFPIPRGGQAFAVLSVYHPQAGAFEEEAATLLAEMSSNIAFALDNFDRETRRKEAENSLLLAASVYENSSEAILIADADNRIIAVNPAFTHITGYSAAEAVGQEPNMLKSGRHDEMFYRAMWYEIKATGKWQGEIWDRRKNGEIYPKWQIINTIFDENGAVLRRIAFFTDISQKKQSEEMIWRQANFDALTGLPNRRMFHDRLEQEIKKSHRDGLPLALLFLDIDHFKEVNDTLGHAKGDILLKEAALRIVNCIRESDTVARFGGDEFTLILGELDEIGDAERLAQRLVQRLSEPFQLGDEFAYVSASIGVTLYPSDTTDIETLLKNADQAMYAAKSAGRNRFNYFTPAMQVAAQTRMRLANELRSALAERQFQVAYQPIVELETRAVRKAEALIRWRHPTLGEVSPAEFIPVAEHTGLIVEIGEWMFHQAALQAKRWRELYGREFQISVNKSPVQIHDKRAEPWRLQLQRLGLPGEGIVVEITEGLLLEVSAFINEKLLEFHAAGIQVALDDFGTGYSSLSYINQFDIDYIKIDRSFVCKLAADSKDMALCEAIIVMAHKLGMKVIAEGIETEEQRLLLTAAGCDYGQGYLFGKPVPAAEFESLLARA